MHQEAPPVLPIEPLTAPAWLTPWPAARVLQCDARVLVVDKPPGLPVHGGPEGEANDVVSRLAVWLTGRGEDSYLGVHQRLDKDTSGVLFFVRDPLQNPRVAVEMEAHRSRRRYVAVVRFTGAPTSGLLEDRLQTSKTSSGLLSRVVPRGGKICRARYRVLERNADRALLELFPETGRTHQLRVQLAARGMPVFGDRLYGGPSAERLMLHCAELSVEALDLRASAPVPGAFGRLLGAGTGSVRENRAENSDVRLRLADALTKRWPLRQTTDTLRLVHELGDGYPGVSVDAYGGWAVLSVYTPEARAQAELIASALSEAGFRGVYLKQRVKADLRQQDQAALAPADVLCGEPAPEELVVREGAARYLVRLGEGLSTGLFVDQRDNRARVLEASAGLRVLNLFSYTCSFSVAAGLGGASEVVSVDLSSRSLAWGERNLALNGIAASSQRLLKADVSDYLGRAARRGERFGLIVLDPPSFGSHGRRSFSVERDYPRLMELACSLLSPTGKLLAVTNHRKSSPERLRSWLSQAARAAGRTPLRLTVAPQGLDCPAWPDGSPTKAVWLEVA